MSGKRILDVLALLNVSRNIATKHFDIRLAQVKLYGQTSSIAKVLRTQALPVLATTISRFASSHSPPKPLKEGIHQDHFYKPSDQNSPAEQPPHGELDIAQSEARRNPLPDGTILPKDNPIGLEISDGITFNEKASGEPPQLRCTCISPAYQLVAADSEVVNDQV